MSADDLRACLKRVGLALRAGLGSRAIRQSNSGRLGEPPPPSSRLVRRLFSPVAQASRLLPEKKPRPAFARCSRRAFTLLEVLLSLMLVSLVLVGLNTFIFSMGELWGRNTDVRLFEQHVRAVTRFLEHELRSAALPPAAQPNSTPIALQEVRPQNGVMEKMLTFELPAGSRLFTWPDRPLPEVVCSFQARPNEGLILLWHSRLEKNFETDAPRETVVTPLVTGLAYDYFEPDFKRWTTETQLKNDPQGQPMAPQRLRLKFTYGKMSRNSVVTLIDPSQALPAF